MSTEVISPEAMQLVESIKITKNTKVNYTGGK